MGRRRQIGIAVGLGICGIALSLWGVFRGGTAAELLPEEQPAPAAAVPAEPAEEAPGGIVMKYDANKYIRTKPLQDPFHVEMPLPEAGKGKAKAPPADKGSAAPAAAPAPAAPVLQGVLALGSDRRAMVSFGGETKTLCTGEQVGTWTVTEIAEKQIVLSGPAGEITLSL